MFKELYPKRGGINTRDSIRIIFTRLTNKKYMLILFIGKNITEKFPLGNRVKFYVSIENNSIFKIVPCINGNGYKLTETSNCFRLTLRWHEFIPSQKDFTARAVPFRIVEDGIEIDYRGTQFQGSQ